MAKMSDIKIGIDSWLTNTRIYVCLADCSYRDKKNGTCRFKQISLNTDAQCENFKRISTKLENVETEKRTSWFDKIKS